MPDKFIIEKSTYEDSFDYIVFLSDLSYWASRYEELSAWSQQHGCELLGMTINIPSEEVSILFILKWG